MIEAFAGSNWLQRAIRTIGGVAHVSPAWQPGGSAARKYDDR